MELVEENPTTFRGPRSKASLHLLDVVPLGDRGHLFAEIVSRSEYRRVWPRDPPVSNRKIIPAHAALLAKIISSPLNRTPAIQC